MGHDVSNMRGFDSFQLLTLFLAALMTRVGSAVIEGAHTSARTATLAQTVPFWGRFRSPAGPCRGCLYCRVPQTLRRPEPERVDKSRLSPWRSPAESPCTGRYLRRHLRSLRSHTPSPPPGRLRWHARRRLCGSPTASAASSLLGLVGRPHSLGPRECGRHASGASWLRAPAVGLPQTRDTLFGTFSTLLAHTRTTRDA